MKKGVYTEVETEAVVRKYLPVAKHVLVKTLKEAEQAARKVKFPLVLKIISKKALHKTEVNGVRVVKNKGDLEEEFMSLMKIVKKKRLPLEGVLVQEFVNGESIILGLKKDPVFGHVLAFGIGGVYAELLHDVAFRVCPITSKDAEKMVDELRMHKLLEGYRGTKVNKKVLVKAMVKVSMMPKKFPEIKEMDINPFVINGKEGKVVDARMVV